MAAAAAVLPRLAFAADSGSDLLTADLGKIADFASGQPTLVVAQFRDSSGKMSEEEKVYVRAVKGGGWVVLSAICTHLKCKIKYDAGGSKFACPCHHSEFDLEGHVLKKPAKKNLPDYSSCVSEEDGHLILSR